MNKDQGIGGLLLVGGLIGLVLYAWLLYAYAIVVLQITVFVAVAAVLLIIVWIGWTMATTPPPSPLEPEVVSAPTTSSPAEKLET